MKKTIFSIIFTIIIILSSIFVPFTVGAYEVTEFEVTADAGALISLDTGEFLYEKNLDKKIYPAAITNIMTAVIVLESEKYADSNTITMTEEALNEILGTGCAVSHLKAGEIITHLDLVHLITVTSCGDCSLLAAKYFGGSVKGFVKMMNEKAKELGLENTHFTNPLGLHDDDHYTTVNDIYKLSTYALKNKTFKTASETSRYKLGATNMSNGRTYTTTNFLQDTTTAYYYRYAKGIKTGFTDEAGRCVVSTASYNGYNYMCILMGCKNNPNKRQEFIQSANLYRWAFNNFSFKEIAHPENPVCEIPVNYSMDTDFVPLYVENGFISILPNDADTSTIIMDYHFKEESVDAPIKKGEILGTADVIYAERVIGKVNLVAGNDVSSNWMLVTFGFFEAVITSVYVKIIFAVVLAAIIVFIIVCIVMNLDRKRKKELKFIPYNPDKEDKINR